GQQRRQGGSGRGGSGRGRDRQGPAPRGGSRRQEGGLFSGWGPGRPPAIPESPPGLGGAAQAPNHPEGRGQPERWAPAHRPARVTGYASIGCRGELSNGTRAFLTAFTSRVISAERPSSRLPASCGGIPGRGSGAATAFHPGRG